MGAVFVGASMVFRVAVVFIWTAGFGAMAQQPVLHSLNALPLREDGLVLKQPVRTNEPFTVAGPQGLIAGTQNGVVEAWVLPVKILSHLTVEANVDGYPVPLNLNAMASEIEVHPDRTTITYSHIALVLRQTMFAPESATAGTGAVVLFQVDSVRPVELTFRFIPEMRKMWPAPGRGSPSAEWVTQGSSGYYVLHTDFPDFAGAVAVPGATHGLMAQYQERPEAYPLEFRLRVDPKTDSGRVYPLLLAVGETRNTATNAALEAKLAELDQSITAIYAKHAARFRDREKTLTQIVTPDLGLNADFTWAETSIEQLQTKASNGETGLVAGYYESGDSARPGFGWFFGRDALFTLYAVDSFGDFVLAREELEFLMRCQRNDGKIMHEYSQTAAEVDWKALPYEYAAADSTPLFLTAMLDYVRTSGDVAFLRAHREAVLKAWAFEMTHDANGDGIYDNAQGTGWVESWPSGMPKQEIYLALLDEQASRAMAVLGVLLGEEPIASNAKKRSEELHKIVEREYYLADLDGYAFSWNGDGKVDSAKTVFPAVAWWNGGPGLDHAQTSLRRWASHDFSTDWGIREVAESDRIYDSMSYHQGSVWPLFTGWTAMAQYRAGNSLAGYQSTMQNADLTTTQDPGAVTELLSGEFFEPFGRSTCRQLWSSAMVITPVLRGIFGIEVDGLKHALKVTPRLPADWDHAEIQRLHVGDSVVNVEFKRKGSSMSVSLRQVEGVPVRIVGAPPGESILRVPLPEVEVSVGHGLPSRGARTTQMKVLSEKIEGRSMRLELEGVARSQTSLRLRRNDRSVRVTVEGAEQVGDNLRVSFGPGNGYVTQVVIVRW
jgi:glycogen debranching enzyme